MRRAIVLQHVSSFILQTVLMKYQKQPEECEHCRKQPLIDYVYPVWKNVIFVFEWDIGMSYFIGRLNELWTTIECGHSSIFEHFFIVLDATKSQLRDHGSKSARPPQWNGREKLPYEWPFVYLNVWRVGKDRHFLLISAQYNQSGGIASWKRETGFSAAPQPTNQPPISPTEHNKIMTYAMQCTELQPKYR